MITWACQHLAKRLPCCYPSDVLWGELNPSALPRLAELDVDLYWRGLGGRDDVSSSSCGVKDCETPPPYFYIDIYTLRERRAERTEGKEEGRRG